MDTLTLSPVPKTPTSLRARNAPVGFTYDAESHRYWLNGEELPHVTGILKEAGLCPSYQGFQEAQWRGLHVHVATEWYDLNDLDWNEVYPKWLGYVKAWARFRDDTGFAPTLIEWQGYHPAFRYAGTLDREGTLGQDMVAQLDLKTGHPEPWHPFQTAGYYLLRGITGARRGCVYLKEDGSYQLAWHDDPGDLKVFMAALTIASAKRRL